jgi:phage gpG-like protein
MDFQAHDKKVTEECLKIAGLGVEAAGKFLKSRIKEVISEPAPRKRVTSRKTGTIYYRAKTKAKAGAPPRKLSGQLRRSITEEYSKVLRTSRVGTNVIYARRLEKGINGKNAHPYLVKTMERYQSQLSVIIGQQFSGGGSK